MFNCHHTVWPKGLSHQLTLPQTSVYTNLEISAQRYPDKPALIFYGRALSYAQLKHEADALAGFLQQRCGVQRGDRVLLFMQNSPQFVIAYYAILRADAMVVPINPMNLSAEVQHYLRDCGARTVICGQELYAQVRPLLGQDAQHAIVATYADYVDPSSDIRLPDAAKLSRQPLSDKQSSLWHEALALGLQPGAHQAGPEDLCVMPYTSGTTGQPKGCVHTHASVMMTAVAGVRWVGGVADSVVLASLPFFHVTGRRGSMNGPIFAGSSIVIMQRWDRDSAAELIARYRITSWSNISTMAIDFLANPNLDKYDVSSLVSIGGGGAAMPEAVAQRLIDLTGLHYIEGYGLSETIAPTHINPPDKPKKQCLGIPIFATDARVIDPESKRELGPNETGEIISSGPQILREYWNKPEANAEAFIQHDGKRFFRTGDLGYYDDEGYFFIVDRLKRMINAAGFKVWPAEVETRLYAHPAVQEACVISALDEYRGETVKALIVLREASRGQITPEQIIEWARGEMAAYKVPRLVEFRDTLPKSPTGKVQWRLLQEEQAGRVGNSLPTRLE
jgi:fatty-acyl-CoA synthase